MKILIMKKSSMEEDKRYYNSLLSSLQGRFSNIRRPLFTDPEPMKKQAKSNLYMQQ
jgi:hypothetical protein